MRRKIINLGLDYITKAKEEKIDEEGENLIEEMEHELCTLASSGNYDIKVYSLTDSIKGALGKIE